MTLPVLLLLALASPLAIVPFASAYTPMTLQAGGSTFVNPVMQVWVAGFQAYSGGAVTTNYQAVGSGSGINNVLNGIFDWAGSDAVVSASQLVPYASKGPLLQIPETLGGVAIFYNVPGVTVSLKLTGPIIADIYLGIITQWNDPAIAALNPSVTLPANTIIPVHRSDGSGTTFALTHYFEQVSSDWNASWTNGVISTSGCPCFGTSINWPSFEIAAKGSGGVAAYVQGNPNTIGYADSYYAFYNNLKAAAVENMQGQFLVPTLANIASAASDFSAQIQANPTFTITNAPGINSYAIATFTYLLVFANQPNQGKGADIAAEFWWIVTQGQAYGPPLYYPKLPANVVTIDEGLIEQMNYLGKAFVGPTTTTITCLKTTQTVGLPVACKATVAGTKPKGAVTWTSDDAGKFSKTTCLLAGGHCTVFFTSYTSDPHLNLTASYLGDGFNEPSVSPNFGLNITQHKSFTTVTCAPSVLIHVSGSMTCTAHVNGFHIPKSFVSGTVTFTNSTIVSGFADFAGGVNTCSLALGKCSVTIIGTTAGSLTLTATFNGNTENLVSSRNHIVIVRP